MRLKFHWELYKILIAKVHFQKSILKKEELVLCRKQIRVILTIFLVIALVLAAGCSTGKKQDATTESTASKTETQEKTSAATSEDTSGEFDPAKVSGKVVFATFSWDVEKAQKMVEGFNQKFPNISVEIVGFDGDLNNYLTTQAASNALPDVVWGWENLNYPISQGWVYPLDEFLEKDDESQYLPKTAMDSYKFGGKTYAVPFDVQFNSMLVNLDLIDLLNMDPPSYEWTIEEFKEYVTKSTTDKYSGINHLWDFDVTMSGVMSKDLHQLCYDIEEGIVKLSSGGWVKALALQKELKAVPGLVSDDLKNEELREQGKEDDYQKKFGKDADALRESKVLLGFHGTWDWSWIKTMNYKYDFYPLPQDSSAGYRQAVHFNHAFMISTAKYPEAAFQFLKWISYGRDGSLLNLELLKNSVDAEGNPSPDFYIPATTHPDVVKVFEESDIVPNGLKYLYKNIDKTFRGDLYKFVPGWDKAVWEVIFPVSEEIRQGKVEASAIAAELEEKANAELKAAKDEFEKQLAEVQAKFPELRKQVEESLK